jgi:hypothetical protein
MTDDTATLGRDHIRGVLSIDTAGTSDWYRSVLPAMSLGGEAMRNRWPVSAKRQPAPIPSS